jgi:hypothetical protein
VRANLGDARARAVVIAGGVAQHGMAYQSSTHILTLDCIEEGRHLGGRLHVMNPHRSRRIGDKLPVSGRHSAMAKPNDLVAVHSTCPHWTVFRPALRSCEQTLDQVLCHPAVVRDERQIDVDQRVGFGEPLPGRSDAAKAVNDPLVLAQQVRMPSNTARAELCRHRP